MFGIELLYTHPFTPVPYQVPIFPLGIVYAVLFFLLFTALYIVSMFVHIKGFIGYIGLIIFSTGILVLDFFSGKTDIVSTTFPINFPQLCSVFLIAWCAYELYQVYISSNPKTYNVGTK
ncbi:MAG: hypothetical protein H6767_06245 [Candidatus Peribacteria bacterium]|nr:MAG: hypothetical protein H6767_06245 [Candidatus Peribacteria bacterium]